MSERRVKRREADDASDSESDVWASVTMRRSLGPRKEGAPMERRSMARPAPVAPPPPQPSPVASTNNGHKREEAQHGQIDAGRGNLSPLALRPTRAENGARVRPVAPARRAGSSGRTGQARGFVRSHRPGQGQ